MNNYEDFTIKGQVDMRVYDAQGNLKSKVVKPNGINTEFKTHLIKIIGDSTESNAGNTSPTAYNATANKMNAVNTEQYLCEALDPTQTTYINYGEERVDIRFLTTNDQFAVGKCTSGPTIVTSDPYTWSMTSKITDCACTWDHVYLATSDVFSPHVDGGTSGTTTDAGLFNASFDIADADVTDGQVVTTYDTFVITWKLTFAAAV